MRLRKKIFIVILGFTLSHLIYHGGCLLVGFVSSTPLFGDYYWGMIMGSCFALFVFRKD